MIISPKSLHLDWLLQKVNIQILGTGTLCQLKQSATWVLYIGPNGQIGKLKPYVVNIAMNLWGHDLTQQ